MFRDGESEKTVTVPGSLRQRIVAATQPQLVALLKDTVVDSVVAHGWVMGREDKGTRRRRGPRGDPQNHGRPCRALRPRGVRCRNTAATLLQIGQNRLNRPILI